MTDTTGTEPPEGGKTPGRPRGRPPGKISSKAAKPPEKRARGRPKKDGKAREASREDRLTAAAQSGLEPIQRLTRDLRTAAVTLSDTEARYLVDYYYIAQEDRKRSRAQERALDAGREPHAVISWLAEQSTTLEGEIKRALDEYTQGHMMGDWMQEIFGIGPVLTAGLFANLYMGDWCVVCHGHSAAECKARQQNKKLALPRHRWRPSFSCPTVGHWWAFAGIAGKDQKPWAKKTKRPWNQSLRTLCWKIGDSFVKFSNNEDCAYGLKYRERKEFEVKRNEAGGNRHHAEARLTRDKKRGEASKEAAYHREGKLSPGHVDLMARRYTVKLFLSHLHNEWYRRATGKEPPAPYPIAFLGHAHKIPPPI